MMVVLRLGIVNTLAKMKASQHWHTTEKQSVLA